MSDVLEILCLVLWLFLGALLLAVLLEARRRRQPMAEVYQLADEKRKRITHNTARGN